MGHQAQNASALWRNWRNTCWKQFLKSSKSSTNKRLRNKSTENKYLSSNVLLKRQAKEAVKVVHRDLRLCHQHPQGMRMVSLPALDLGIILNSMDLATSVRLHQPHPRNVVHLRQSLQRTTGGASRWTNPMRALGGRFPRAQNANARPESRQSAIQAPPPPSADAMNLEPGAGLAQVCRRSYRLDPREAEGPQTLPDFPDVEVDPEDSEDEPFIKR